MERPERPSRHRSHWKRIRPIKESDSSDSSADSDLNMFGTLFPRMDASGGASSSSRRSRSPDGAGSSTAALDTMVRSINNLETYSLMLDPLVVATPKKPGEDESPSASGPGTSSNYHLLHHDYAERNDDPDIEDQLWDCVLEPLHARKRLRVSTETGAHDSGASSVVQRFKMLSTLPTADPDSTDTPPVNPCSLASSSSTTHSLFCNTDSPLFPTQYLSSSMASVVSTTMSAPAPIPCPTTSNYLGWYPASRARRFTHRINRVVTWSSEDQGMGLVHNAFPRPLPSTETTQGFVDTDRRPDSGPTRPESVVIGAARPESVVIGAARPESAAVGAARPEAVAVGAFRPESAAVRSESGIAPCCSSEVQLSDTEDVGGDVEFISFGPAVAPGTNRRKRVHKRVIEIDDDDDSEIIVVDDQDRSSSAILPPTMEPMPIVRVLNLKKEWSKNDSAERTSFTPASPDQEQRSRLDTSLPVPIPSSPVPIASPTATVNFSAATTVLLAAATAVDSSAIAPVHVTASTSPMLTAEALSALSRQTEEEEALNQGLIGLLECPVCIEYMAPPILQCRRGHLVCAICKPKLPSCPTCRARFSDQRNLAMEKVADKLKYPCKNTHMGCCEYLRLADKKDHESNCVFRTYRCVEVDCDWKGMRSNIMHHMEARHASSVRNGSEQVLQLRLSEGSDQNWIVSALGELFRVNFICMHRLQRSQVQVVGSVQYIGPCKDAPHFQYTMEVRERGGARRRVAYSRATHRDESYQHYASGDAFLMRFDTTTYFSEEVATGSKMMTVQVRLERCGGN